MLVVLAQQRDGQHKIIDIVEHEGVLINVLLFLRQEGYGVVAPVAQRVEVVRGVVAVVVAVAVALGSCVSKWALILRIGGTYGRID